MHLLVGRYRWWAASLCFVASVNLCNAANRLTIREAVQELGLRVDTLGRIATSAYSDSVYFAMFEQTQQRSRIVVIEYSESQVRELGDFPSPADVRDLRLVIDDEQSLVCYASRAAQAETSSLSSQNDNAVFCVTITDESGQVSAPHKIVDHVLDYALVGGGPDDSYGIIATTGPNSAVLPELSVNLVSRSLSVRFRDTLGVLANNREVDRRGQALDAVRFEDMALVSLVEQSGQSVFVQSVLVSLIDGSVASCQTDFELASQRLLWARPVLLEIASKSQVAFVRGDRVVETLELDGHPCPDLNTKAWSRPSKWSDDTFTELLGRQGQ